MTALPTPANIPVQPSVLPQGVQVFERGWLSANNISCVNLADPDRAQTALVDTGYCTHSALTVQLVSTALRATAATDNAGKAKPHALQTLVNTHLHSDHCGGNAALQAAYPAVQTLIPPGHAHLVAAWDARALSYELTGQDCPRFGYTATLQPGSTVQLGAHAWQIHAAPGHDPHSVVLFEPCSRTLISADALWENGFGVVFPELEGHNAFDEVAATLDVIEALNPVTVIPGHGKVFAYTAQHLARARSRLDYFVQNPAKHRRYAAKVLVTYYMLAQQRLPRAELLAWCGRVPYLQLLSAQAEGHSVAGLTADDTKAIRVATTEHAEGTANAADLAKAPFTWERELIDELVAGGSLHSQRDAAGQEWLTA